MGSLGCGRSKETTDNTGFDPVHWDPVLGDVLVIRNSFGPTVGSVAGSGSREEKRSPTELPDPEKISLTLKRVQEETLLSSSSRAPGL